MSANSNTWVWYTVTFLVAGIFVFLSSDAANAQEIGGIICGLSGQLTGTTAKAMATLAVIGVGLMALFGKSSWGTVFVIGAAVALVFGAGNMVTALGGQNACANTPPPFQFSCNNGNAQGNLFSLDTLVNQTTDPVDSVFAHTLFFFKNTVGQVMSSMYCVMSNALVGPFQAVITLLIVVFGLMITTGITNFTMKEAATMLFKIALIWAFAMNATWGIGIGYRFFMNFAEEATSIVLAAIPATGGITPSITAPDAVIAGIFHTTSAGGQAAGTAGPNLADVPQVCLLTLAIFAALLLFFMPFVLFFIAMLILGYIGNFARAMLNYLTSLVLISFLFIFAPFFLGFALFRTTMPLFESWLKHLISFSLQMVVMFGFMAMLSLLPVANFFTMILSLMKEYNKTFDFPAGNAPLVSYTMHWCGVCQFAIGGNSTLPINGQNVVYGQNIACVLHRGATAAQAANTAPGYMLSVDGNYYVISLWNLVEHTDLAKYLIIQVLALYLISRAIGELMRRAPELAKQLGGLASAAAIGGGGGKMGGPGIGYIGLDSVSAGFYGLRNGLLRGGIAKRDWAGRLRAGFMGTEKKIITREDGTKEVTTVKLANAGIAQSILHGAYNERSLEAKEFTNRIERMEKELKKARDKNDSEKAASLERVINNMKQQGVGNFKAGLTEKRDENGLVIHKSSLSNSDFGNETTKKQQEMAKKHRQQKIYGTSQRENPGNWYYGMKMPEDVYTGSHTRPMKELKEHANTMIEKERAKLDARDISEEKKKEIMRSLEIAEIHTKNANSANQMKGITKDIAKIDGRIERFDILASETTQNTNTQQNTTSQETTRQVPLDLGNDTREAIPVGAATATAGAAEKQAYAGSWGTPTASTTYGDNSSHSQTSSSPVPAARGSDGASAWPGSNTAQPPYGQTAPVAKGSDGASLWSPPDAEKPAEPPLSQEAWPYKGSYQPPQSDSSSTSAYGSDPLGLNTHTPPMETPAPVTPSTLDTSGVWSYKDPGQNTGSGSSGLWSTTTPSESAASSSTSEGAGWFNSTPSESSPPPAPVEPAAPPLISSVPAWVTGSSVTSEPAAASESSWFSGSQPEPSPPPASVEPPTPSPASFVPAWEPASPAASEPPPELITNFSSGWLNAATEPTAASSDSTSNQNPWVLPSEEPAKQETPATSTFSTADNSSPDTSATYGFGVPGAVAGDPSTTVNAFGNAYDGTAALDAKIAQAQQAITYNTALSEADVRMVKMAISSGDPAAIDRALSAVSGKKE